MLDGEDSEFAISALDEELVRAFWKKDFSFGCLFRTSETGPVLRLVESSGPSPDGVIVTTFLDSDEVSKELLAQKRIVVLGCLPTIADVFREAASRGWMFVADSAGLVLRRGSMSDNVAIPYDHSRELVSDGSGTASQSDITKFALLEAFSKPSKTAIP